MAIKDIKPVRVNFNLRDHLNKDKETAVHCVVRYNNQKLVISSIELIKPKFWDGDKQRAKSTKQFVGYPEFNQRLDEVEAIVKAAYRTFVTAKKQYPGLDTLKSLIKLELSDQSLQPEVKKVKLIDFIQKFIMDTKSGKRINPKTKQRFAPDSHKAYQNTLGALQRFMLYRKIQISFEDIDLNFYNDFKDYMLGIEKVSNNYFGLLIKNIKLFLNESFEIGLHNNQKHNHKQFTKLQNETDNIYLTENQLNILLNWNFAAKPKLDRVRDLFLVGCWTGLRFSDFNLISAKSLSEEFIELQTQKTGAYVIIPIHDTIRLIMKKYKGLTSNSLPPPISNVNMNRYLKEMAKEVGFDEIQQIKIFKGGNVVIENNPTYELISTHTARRSFATNMYLMGVPSLTIMDITGHKTEKAFLKYIKVTSKEHAVKLREIWQRNSLKIVNQ